MKFIGELFDLIREILIAMMGTMRVLYRSIVTFTVTPRFFECQRVDERTMCEVFQSTSVFLKTYILWGKIECQSATLD